MTRPPIPIPATIATRPVHNGRVISVHADTVRFPDGSTGTLDIVRHPGASAVVPFLGEPGGDDPTVLLIRQYRYATGRWLLEIPAGRLDVGETPEACARRELREETGCTAIVMEPMTTIFTTPGFSDERIHLFLATGLTRGESSHEADEFIEPVAISLTEALSRVESGEISDAKSALALLFAAGFRAGR
ncbi:MAG: NUDIX hydrolase [Gemmatimonadetes bacterium]|nr:NUDIX hydrolase [Gemmatimonadota bacterium]